MTYPIFIYFFFLKIRRPPTTTLSSSSAASDVYKRQVQGWYYRQLVYIGQTGKVSPVPISTFETVLWMDKWDEDCARKMVGPEIEGVVGTVVNNPPSPVPKLMLLGAVMAVGAWILMRTL
eukprot:TRINITY_DN52816_c0_g1_i1.p1 TRINITY_DN52816_c0_g1~~TRINITY_DN52816_c0_g1_i1.p1  ORF type:complete len:120 (+),score=33.03 TRINITY_DN52816_c0_g1_i1:38-397(+)